jgi:Protein of unknown function (DUF4242)
MHDYLVERYLPDLSEADLRTALDRARARCAELSATGTPVRYLGSTFLPGEEACLCRFEAEREETVARANELAELPFSRITEALAIGSDGG